MQTPPMPARAGRPPLTSRARILSAARRIIDDEGWERLTIRRLAEELGVGAPTIYHHVRNREELLILLINQHMDETLPTDLAGTPEERIIAAAEVMRSSLAAWPWAAEVLTADGFLRQLGASARTLIEVILSSAVDAGCTIDDAVHLFRDVWYLTVGEILVRAHSRSGSSAARRGAPGPFFGEIDAERFPLLAAVGDRWPELAAQDTYQIAVEALVQGAVNPVAGG